MTHTLFGQIIIGPPGSGKSTYCKFICENLKQLGRNAKIINLDPANDSLPYKPAVDLTSLIGVQEVMEKCNLGPNGAMIRCIEILEENYGWLYDNIVDLVGEEMKKYDEAMAENVQLTAEETHDLTKNKPYLIIDCPGQSELYTHHTAMKNLIKKISRRNDHFDLRLVCLNLCDAYHASDLSKYVGLVMNSLTSMINLELPHINVLSKVDKIDCYGKTRFNLDFYCEVMNMKYLLDTELENPFQEKYRKLTQAIANVIEDYSLVSFIPLNIQKPEDIYHLLQMADKANGYYVNDLDLSILQLNPKLFELASGRRQEPFSNET